MEVDRESTFVHHHLVVEPTEGRGERTRGCHRFGGAVSRRGFCFVEETGRDMPLLAADQAPGSSVSQFAVSQASMKAWISSVRASGVSAAAENTQFPSVAAQVVPYISSLSPTAENAT